MSLVMKVVYGPRKSGSSWVKWWVPLGREVVHRPHKVGYLSSCVVGWACMVTKYHFGELPIFVWMKRGWGGMQGLGKGPSKRWRRSGVLSHPVGSTHNRLSGEQQRVEPGHPAVLRSGAVLECVFTPRRLASRISLRAFDISQCEATSCLSSLNRRHSASLYFHLLRTLDAESKTGGRGLVRAFLCFGFLTREREREG